MTIREIEKFGTLSELCDTLVASGKAPNHKEAKTVAWNEIPLESKFQSAIMRYLNTIPDGFFWKDQAGPFQAKGIPDICGVYRGQFYGFEVKRPLIGRLTEIQAATHRQMKKAGGQVYVVSYVSEVKAILERRCVE